MGNDRSLGPGRRLVMSSQDLAELRSQWADTGRKVWAAATRAGRDAVGRTEQELETLGRIHQQKVDRVKSKAREARKGVEEGGNTVRRALHETLKAVVPTVQSAARAQTDAILMRRTQQVQATMPPAPFLRAGTSSDPGPGRLYEEFRTGAGPQRRVLGPQSSFSREFATAPSVQEHIQDTLGQWRQRNGGVDMFANPKRADFGVSEFVKDALAGNQASHVIGSFALAGERRGDKIDWWAENDMDLTSYYGGRIARKAGLPTVPKRTRPGPQGSTEQTIIFRTDLRGRPLP